MVPAKCADKRTKLSLTSFNKSEADKFYKHLEVCEKELIIIPICDNVHWFLAALYPRKGQLYIICSLGQTYKNVAYTLKRYFLPRISRVAQDIAVSYPKVPRQNNGIDCGVFTIYYGSDLIQNHKDWTALGGHCSRVKLLKELEEMK